MRSDGDVGYSGDVGDSYGDSWVCCVHSSGDVYSDVNDYVDDSYGSPNTASPFYEQVVLPDGVVISNDFAGGTSYGFIRINLSIITEK